MENFTQIDLAQTYIRSNRLKIHSVSEVRERRSESSLLRPQARQLITPTKPGSREKRQGVSFRTAIIVPSNIVL